MATNITNGSRSNPDNLPVQTRMTPFQIAAMKAIASMDGINSATLLRNLVDAHIERCLTDENSGDRELLVGLLKRAGYAVELERVIGAAIEDELGRRKSARVVGEFESDPDLRKASESRRGRPG